MQHNRLRKGRAIRWYKIYTPPVVEPAIFREDASPAISPATHEVVVVPPNMWPRVTIVGGGVAGTAALSIAHKIAMRCSILPAVSRTTEVQLEAPHLTGTRKSSGSVKGKRKTGQNCATYPIPTSVYPSIPHRSLLAATCLRSLIV